MIFFIIGDGSKGGEGEESCSIEVARDTLNMLPLVSLLTLNGINFTNMSDLKFL